MNGPHTYEASVLEQIAPALPSSRPLPMEHVEASSFGVASWLEIGMTLAGAVVAVGVLLLVLPIQIPGL